MKQEHTIIVFDLGNVLLPFDYRKMIERFEQIEVGLGKKFADFYKTHYDVHRKFERGEYSVEEFTEILLNVLEHKISNETFYEIYSKIFSVNEELVAAMPALKRNYGLVLLSNTNAIHQKYGWERYEFLEYFDKLILSHEVGAVKPETKIYKAVEAFTRKPSQEHFYIDDILEYISAAKKLGWDAVQFVGNEKLFEEFTKHGIVYHS
ncbi:MAG: HAD family phosphatase [Candidatus Kryptoniota bacterium]